MVKQVIWSKKAQNDRKDILNYWIQRNKSKEYSKKLNSLFKEAVKLIASYPEIGRRTNNKSARIKIVRDYLIIYEMKNTQIIILTIWDSRQNPDKLKNLLQK